ncbi:MAG: thioredoxin family protein [Deferrisomatales bacterium]
MRQTVFIALGLAALLTGCAAGQQGDHMGHGSSHLRTEGSLASDIPIPFHSLAEGRDLALGQKQPLLVDFYAPEGCSRCDKMAKHLYGNPEIAQYIDENFVLVRIDLTKNMTGDEIALGRRYDYNYDCLLIFLDHRGEVIEDVGGSRMCFPDFIEPQAFVDYLAMAKAKADSRR